MDDESEKGMFDKMGDQILTGGFIGFAVGSSRAFLNARQFSDQSRATVSQIASKSDTKLSARAIRVLTPTALPSIVVTTASFAGIGAAFAGLQHVIMNTRQKDDMWNNVIAGSMAASLAGLRSGSLYVSGGAAAAVGAGMAFVSLLGGTIGSIDNSLVEERKQLYRD